MTKESPTKAVAVVAGLVLLCVFYALIISSILGTAIFSNIASSGSADNETILDVSNVTARTVTNAGLDEFVMSVSLITNATDGIIISAGNYTAGTDGTIIATDAGATSTFNGTDWNVTYTYTYDTETTLSGLNVNNVKSQSVHVTISKNLSPYNVSNAVCSASVFD